MNLKDSVWHYCPTILHIFRYSVFNLFVAFLCGFKLSWCQCSENINQAQSFDNEKEEYSG